jgi:hypothetical protein
VFAMLIRSLSTAAEDLSSLPVGIVDYDKSSCSEALVSALGKVETLRMVGGSEKELRKLLLDEMITSYFVIEKDYETHIKTGDLKKLITMYYKQDNKSSSIIADIVAGEMLYPIGLYTGLRYYNQLPVNDQLPAGQKLSENEYISYMKNLVESSKDFNFAFRIVYAKPGNSKLSEEPLPNSILYNQFIFGILGIMIAFIAMFILSQTVSEKENGVDIRLKISGFSVLKRDIGNLAALLLWEGVLALFYTWLILRQLDNGNGKLWLSVYLLLLLNSTVLGGIMLLLTKVIKKMLLYQILCSTLILLSGGLGFYQMLSGFYQGFIEDMVKFIPNSWFIREFTDIIVYGSRDGYSREGYHILAIMAISVISLIISIDLIQGLLARKNEDRTVTLHG